MGGSRKATTVNCKEIVRGTSLILLCSTPCSWILPWVKFNPPASSAGRLHPLTAPLNTTQKIHDLILDKPSKHWAAYSYHQASLTRKLANLPWFGIFFALKLCPQKASRSGTQTGKQDLSHWGTYWTFTSAPWPKSQAHTKKRQRQMDGKYLLDAHTNTLHSVPMQREIQAHSSLTNTKTWKTTKLTNFAGSDKHLFQAKKQILITCPLVMHLWEVLKAFPHMRESFDGSHITPFPIISALKAAPCILPEIFIFFANTCCGRTLSKSTTQAGS